MNQKKNWKQIFYHQLGKLTGRDGIFDKETARFCEQNSEKQNKRSNKMQKANTNLSYLVESKKIRLKF